MLDGPFPPAGGIAARLVERGPLMRVLPVTKLFGALEHHVQGLRQRVSTVTGIVSLIEPASDRGVVSSRVGEGGTCQSATREIAHDAIGT